MVVRKELLPILVRETAIRANELARSIDPAYTSTFSVSAFLACLSYQARKEQFKLIREKCTIDSSQPSILKKVFLARPFAPP